MKCEWREICGSNIYIYIYRERERKIMIVNWMRGVMRCFLCVDLSLSGAHVFGHQTVEENWGTVDSLDHIHGMGVCF